MLPIIWTEGAFLGQQHFQYWESWLLAQNAHVIDSMVAYPYGLVSYSFDTAALLQKQVKVTQLTLRRPCGTWIILEPDMQTPLMITLGDQTEIMVYLNIPNNDLCAGLSGYEAHADQAGYRASYQVVSDRYDHNRKHELTLGQPALLLSTSPLDGFYESWPLALFKRAAGGQYNLDNDFIPVCLSIGACAPLISHLNSVNDTLCAQIKKLESRLKQHQDPVLWERYDYLAGASFELGSLLQQGTAHPKTVYELLSRLQMKLLMQHRDCFHPEYYVHERMGEQLINRIAGLYEALKRETESIKTFTMNKNAESHHCVSDLSPELLAGHQWILGVDCSNLPEGSLIRFISQSKLGTPQTLDAMIASALPGIVFTHMSRPPKVIHALDGFEYFRVDHHCPDWKHVKDESALMLHVPALFNEAKIILDVIKE